MTDSTSKSWFYRFLPLASALSVLNAILATDKLPEYVLWLASVMAIALLVAWLVSELSWSWVPRIFSRRSKITKEQYLGQARTEESAAVYLIGLNY